MSRSASGRSVRAALFAAGAIGGILVSPIVPALAIVALALFWRAYEALALGLMMDFLWLPPGHLPFFTLGSVLIVWLLEPLRSEFLS